jgi:hypothetical protein
MLQLRAQACALRPALVNHLLTFFIKVNIPSAAESQCSRTGIQDEEAYSGTLELLDLASWWWSGQRRGQQLSCPPARLSFVKRLLLQALFVWVEL